MMPTTMKSAALNIACATTIVMPARAASRVPMPTRTIMKPSWLTVPKARTSLRSYARMARQPARIIDSRPKLMMVMRHGGESAYPGARRATR